MYYILTIGIICGYIFITVKYSSNDYFRNPIFFYTLFQMIGFIGVVSILDFDDEIDITYFYVYYVPLLFSLLGFFCGIILFPINKKTALNWEKKELIIEKGFVYNKAIYIMAIFSAVISIIYFVAVGYNVFLLGIVNILQTGESLEEASALRLASYDVTMTGNYFYPGYVNQFKDTLFPLALFFLWAVFALEEKTKYPFFTKTLLIILSICSLICILGTGQRGAFVVALIMGLSFLVSVLNFKKVKKVAIYLVPLFVLFMASTLINGRSETNETNDVLKAVFQRIMSDNQVGARIGFREIIYHKPTQWGSEWFDGILGILPSHTGSTLSNDIAQLIWGGFGTVPPSNWASIYYNFSWIGLIIFPFFLTFILRYLYYRLYKKEKKLFRILIYIYCFSLIGTWIAGSPFEHYLNTGLLTIIILKLILKFSELFFGFKYIKAKMY